MATFEQTEKMRLLWQNGLPLSDLPFEMWTSDMLRHEKEINRESFLKCINSLQYKKCATIAVDNDAYINYNDCVIKLEKDVYIDYLLLMKNQRQESVFEIPQWLKDEQFVASLLEKGCLSLVRHIPLTNKTLPYYEEAVIDGDIRLNEKEVCKLVSMSPRLLEYYIVKHRWMPLCVPLKSKELLLRCVAVSSSLVNYLPVIQDDELIKELVEANPFVVCNMLEMLDSEGNYGKDNRNIYKGSCDVCQSVVSNYYTTCRPVPVKNRGNSTNMMTGNEAVFKFFKLDYLVAAFKAYMRTIFRMDRNLRSHDFWLAIQDPIRQLEPPCDRQTDDLYKSIVKLMAIEAPQLITNRHYFFAAFMHHPKEREDEDYAEHRKKIPCKCYDEYGFEEKQSEESIHNFARANRKYEFAYISRRILALVSFWETVFTTFTKNTSYIEYFFQHWLREMPDHFKFLPYLKTFSAKDLFRNLSEQQRLEHVKQFPEKYIHLDMAHRTDEVILAVYDRAPYLFSTMPDCVCAKLGIVDQLDAKLLHCEKKLENRKKQESKAKRQDVESKDENILESKIQDDEASKAKRQKIQDDEETKAKRQKVQDVESKDEKKDETNDEKKDETNDEKKDEIISSKDETILESNIQYDEEIDSVSEASDEDKTEDLYEYCFVLFLKTCPTCRETYILKQVGWDEYKGDHGETVKPPGAESVYFFYSNDYWHSDEYAEEYPRVCKCQKTVAAV